MENGGLFSFNDFNTAAALLITFPKIAFAHAVIGCFITSVSITMGFAALFFATFVRIFTVLEAMLVIAFCFFVASMQIHVGIPQAPVIFHGRDFFALPVCSQCINLLIIHTDVLMSLALGHTV
jgi:hypothetical protein